MNASTLAHANDGERLHATDARGRLLKTALRSDLEPEGRAHAIAHGDAPFALPVVYVFLASSDGRLHLVKRGNTKENPLMWDKTCGGHVAAEPEDARPPRAIADATVARELDEELAITDVRVAGDAFDYAAMLADSDVDRTRIALAQLLVVDSWLETWRVPRDGGPPFLRRHRAAIYRGVYDGPVTFRDQTAHEHALVSLDALHTRIANDPASYTRDLGVMLHRFGDLLLSRV